ncbi:MAG: hypothetical protein H0X51_02565 [Parachlamydiaceae bacterium]|nr:hypothetical protein [Parachlamydiaceae bacterium]
MQLGNVSLYDRSNIDKLEWPETEDGQYAKRFLMPFILNGVRHYIDNVDTEMMALKIDNLVLPITVNDSQYENSFVCSTYGHYVLAAYKFMDTVHRGLRSPLKMLVRVLDTVLRRGRVNKAVIVNNWMFATNLYPEISSEQMGKIKKYLQEHFPQHAILFFSVHRYGDQKLYTALKNNRYSMLASRKVFFLNAKDETVFNSRIFKSDWKVFRESGYAMMENAAIPSVAVARLTTLYRNIYVERYQMGNPQLNENFMRLAIDNQLLQFRALHKDGDVHAVVGYVHRNGIMNAPLLGYDTSMPKEGKLYRVASTLLNMEAKKRGELFHLSSGASTFKCIRKGIGVIEYTAVCHRHLPLMRRLPWWFLQGITNSVGIPFMKYIQ